MGKYISLVILTLAMGLFTWLAVTDFKNENYFGFGVDVAFDIWWILKLVMLVLEW